MEKTDILIFNKGCSKLYDKLCDEVGKKFALTQIEIEVLSFLASNSKQDTASDIVEMRLLVKSNVSQAVDRLIARKFLVRIPDSEDRRKIHLKLTKESKPVVNEILIMQKNYGELVFADFTEKDMAMAYDVIKRVARNTFFAMSDN